MLRLLTAGESHGPKLTVIVDGMPAGLNLDFDFIKAELKARQGGFGRSGRQKLEQDAIDITGGVRHGATTGAPLPGFPVASHGLTRRNLRLVSSASLRVDTTVPTTIPSTMA